MHIRAAKAADSAGVSLVLQELVAAGQRSKPADLEFARSHYVEHPDQLMCSVAETDADGIIGLQSLKIATSANAYGTPVGYGIIGTHIRPQFKRLGAGRLLFQHTYEAAKQSNLRAIEACIGPKNETGIAFYEALGFVTYRRFGHSKCKRIWVR